MMMQTLPNDVLRRNSWQQRSNDKSTIRKSAENRPHRTIVIARLAESNVSLFFVSYHHETGHDSRSIDTAMTCTITPNQIETSPMEKCSLICHLFTFPLGIIYILWVLVPDENLDAW